MFKRLLLCSALLLGISQAAQAQAPSTVGPRYPVGPVKATQCVAGPGVDIVSPSINIQAAVNTHPGLTTFCFLPGTYMNFHVTPKAGNKFIGSTVGVILDGGGKTNRAFVSTGQASGNVTIQNLVVQNYIGGYQVPAIDGQNSQGWHIVHNEVRMNDGVGVAFAGGGIVQANYIHHNQEMGYGSNPGLNIQILDNEIAFNNYNNQYNCGDECGGGKLWSTTTATVSYNYTNDNHGPGFWDDYDNNNITYSFNRIEGNWTGIQHEIGYNASIHDNYFANNGNSSATNPSCSWLWCSAIGIYASGGTTSPVGTVEIFNNTIITGSKYGNAVGLVQQNRTGTSGQEPCCGPWLVQNVNVHDNTIDLSKGGGSGGVTDENNKLLYGANRNIVFQNNHYTLGTNTGGPLWWNGTQMGFAAWQKLGFDTTGTVQ